MDEHAQDDARALNAERRRLENQRRGTENWRQWGPYLSERAWGTVREDYGAGGDAWGFLPHEHARSRAYRWNEDGLGGICDENQILCFALALWNGRDPILKERAFGLTGVAGQSRRGRQGGLLLPRRHAQPQLPALSLQVSADAVSLRASWSRKTRSATVSTRRTGCWRPARSPKAATSTSR